MSTFSFDVLVDLHSRHSKMALTGNLDLLARARNCRSNGLLCGWPVHTPCLLAQDRHIRRDDV